MMIENCDMTKKHLFNPLVHGFVPPVSTRCCVFATPGVSNFEKPLFWSKFFHLIFLFQTGPDFKIPKKIWIILELQKVPKKKCWTWKKIFFYIFFLISLYFLADLRVTYNCYFGPTVNSFPTISAQTPCVAKTQHRVLTG